MAFRDDREALLARMAALEAELSRERADKASEGELRRQLDKLAEQVAATAAEVDEDRAALGEIGAAIARLQRRYALPEPRPEVAPPPEPARAQGQPRSPRLALGVAILVMCLGALLVALGRKKKSEAGGRDPGMIECSIESTPPGAELVAMGKLRSLVRDDPNKWEFPHENVKGKTPLRLTRMDIITEAQIYHVYRWELRLPGHQPAEINPGGGPDGCAPIRVTLVPIP